MKRILLYLTVLTTGLAACSSPVKEHNKEVQQKANKLQNVQSGPLSGQKDTTGAADTQDASGSK